MNWVANCSNNENAIQLLHRIDRVTLYEHNFCLTKDFVLLTFTCLLNCKRLSNRFSIIGKIEGDLSNRFIQISYSLMDDNQIFCGQWPHHRLQLIKFAYYYNERSAKNISKKATQNSNHYQFKSNPVNGQFYTTITFYLADEEMEEVDKLKRKITEQCQNLTTESQKIFNSVLQVIFNIEAKDPYLNADGREASNYNSIKVNRILKTIKNMNAISNAYKIRADIGNMNRFRSVFKKIFLRKQEKMMHNKEVIETALLAVPKLCSQHFQETQDPKKRVWMIEPFVDIEDSIEVQLAIKHLDDFKTKTGQSVMDITQSLNPEQLAELTKPGVYKIRNKLFLIQEFSTRQQKIYEYEIISRLSIKHPNIVQYYHIRGEPYQNLRITEYNQQIPLRQYLTQQKHTLSLTSRLQIMCQIVSVVQALHKYNIGFFIDQNNVFVDGNFIKIRYFRNAFSVSCWDETKQKQRNNATKFLMNNYKEYLFVCGYEQNRDKQKMEKQTNKEKFENQRADVMMLGMLLYRILFDKFPFSTNCVSTLMENGQSIPNLLMQVWTVETETFIQYGGVYAKILAQLILKCMYFQVEKRPFVEWIKVIVAELKSSLDNFY